MRRPPTLPVTSRLVDKQVLGRDLAARAALEGSSLDEPRIEDFLSISQTVGLDVRPIARRIGQALSWPVLDHEVLNEMAEGEFEKLRDFECLEEHDLSWLEDVALGIASSKYAWNEYVHRLTEAVLSIARRKKAVFLGRATDLILPRDRGLRLRIFASPEATVRAHAREREIPVEIARREIEALRERRRHFIESHFHADSDDPSRHDLLVNLERFTEDQIVELVLAARRIRP